MSTTLTHPTEATTKKNQQAAVALPKPDGDFYQVTECLSETERELLKRVRAFMETKVAPIINQILG